MPSPPPLPPTPHLLVSLQVFELLATIVHYIILHGTLRTCSSNRTRHAHSSNLQQYISVAKHTNIHRPLSSTPAPYLKNKFQVATLPPLRAQCQNLLQLCCNQHQPRDNRPYTSLVCLRCSPTVKQDQGLIVYNVYLPIDNFSHLATTCPLLALERDKISTALEGVITDLGIMATSPTGHYFPSPLFLMLANDLPLQWNPQWRKLSLPHCATFCNSCPGRSLQILKSKK